MKKILLFLLVMLPLTITAAPTTGGYATATWNANAGFTDGYSFYCSPTVGDFKTTPLDVPGKGTGLISINLSDLGCTSQPDGDYFLAVTAYWNDPNDGKLKESGADSWIPLKLVAGMFPLAGIPAVPNGLKIQ